MNKIVAPSLLSANFLNLEKDILLLNKSNAKWIHFDIMDGVFVPNISFGFQIIKSVKSITNKIIDVHLMIVDPDRYIDKFVESGADILTVHYEAVTHLNRTISQIKAKGIKAGISLNPHTPINVLEEILPYTDLVLLMSVNPGFGGQKFIPTTIQKVEKLNLLKQKLNPSCIIQVDGGINFENSQLLFQAGANSLVIGNSIFTSEDPISEIDRILQL